MIDLPWETEHVVESSKGVMDSMAVVVSLISSLTNPTQFAIVITLDEDKSNEPVATGFMAKMKSMASSAASQAVKVQRQVTAGNKLAAVYDVKFVLPLCVNLVTKIVGGSLVLSWKDLAGDKVVKLSNLNSQWMNAFTAAKEVSVTKFAHEFEPLGSNGLFKWLWKFQPVQILPMNSGDQAAPELSTEDGGGKILCFTWNVAGLTPPEDSIGSVLNSSKLKENLISFFKTTSQDIVLLCLQEASPLNAKTVMFKGENLGDLWMEFFQDCLDCASKPNGSFWVKAAGTVQVGLAIGLFVVNNEKQSRVANVSSPLTSCVKTGTLGLTGNKGSVALYTKIGFKNDLSMCVSILNLHLASGEGKAEFRKTELARVINESSFGENKGIHFFDSHLAIVTGDLNSRMVDEFIDSEGVEISSNDELIARMEQEKTGFLFSENPVKFPATYKLVPEKEGKLIFAENRKPGWCDRILFRSSLGEGLGKFVCSEYKSVRNIDFSDHTPVYGMFTLVFPAEEEEHAVAPPKDKNSPSGSSNDSDLYDN